MPQLPNPDKPGQPGVRGRETETTDKAAVTPGTPPKEGEIPGRQPQHPGQPGRYQDTIGERDEPAGG